MLLQIASCPFERTSRAFAFLLKGGRGKVQGKQTTKQMLNRIRFCLREVLSERGPRCPRPLPLPPPRGPGRASAAPRGILARREGLHGLEGRRGGLFDGGERLQGREGGLLEEVRGGDGSGRRGGSRDFLLPRDQILFFFARGDREVGGGHGCLALVAKDKKRRRRRPLSRGFVGERAYERV
jgi:hypothetical protein